MFKKNFSVFIFLLVNLLYSQEKELIIRVNDSVLVHTTQISKLRTNIILDSIINQVEVKGIFQYDVKRKENNNTNFIQIFAKTSFDSIKIPKPKEKLRLQFFNIVSSNNTFSNEFLILPINEYATFIKKLILACKKKGYPFVIIKAKKINVINGELIATLDIQLNKNKKIDKIIVQGYKKFPLKYLNNLQRILNSRIYNDKNIHSLNSYFTSLDFVETIKDPEVLFKKDSTIVYIYLKKRKINSFDGLLGFKTEENNSKLNINGYLNLELKNIFDKGNTYSLYWNSNGDKSVIFRLKSKTPFIFKSALTNEVNFNIYKRDSINMNVYLNENLFYTINSNHSLYASYNYEFSNSLLKESIATNSNFKKYFLGLGYVLKLPQKSYYEPLRIRLNTFYKLGNRNNDNTVDKQYIYGFDLKYSQKLIERFFLNNILHYKKLESNNFLQNELFVLGGFSSLRGFRNASIFANKYLILNSDLKWYQNKNSSFNIISDFGLIYNGTIKNKIFSLGLGYQFKVSKNGYISLNYIVSKQNNTSFNENILGINLKTFF